MKPSSFYAVDPSTNQFMNRFTLEMTRRQQDMRKIQFCLVKLGINALPLAPHIFGDYISIVEAPLETTRYLAALYLLIDIITFRFLFLEDLVARKGQAAIWKGPPWSFPNAGLYVLGSVVGFFVGIILFGAPMFDSWLETLHLAMLLTVLTATPFCLVYAQPVDDFLKLIQTLETDMNMDKACFVPGLMAIVGAWSGSVVIPLDWDRPWQKWPIPCCYGAFAGYALGNCGWLAVLLWKWWRRSVHRSLSKSERFVE